MPARKTTSKRKPGVDYQPTLFPGFLNIDIPLRASVSEALRTCDKDRYQVVAEMSRLTGMDIAKSALDNWSSESRAKSGDGLDLNNNKRWGIPAELLPAFCEVTGDTRPLELIAIAVGLRICKKKELLQQELIKLDKQAARLDKKRKELISELSNGEGGE